LRRVLTICSKRRLTVLKYQLLLAEAI
jgi:hypothetical protein